MACSDGVVLVDVTTEGKTPIEVYAGWADAENDKAVTRTVITDDEHKPLNAFPANTSLYMLMQSNDMSGAGRATKVTRTIMFALPQSDDEKHYSEVNYSASNEYNKFVRYWDDVYARDAAVSIVAACTPGMGPNVAGQTNNKAWYLGGTNVFDKQEWTDLPAGITPEQYNSYATISWPIGSSTQISNNAFLTDQSRTFDKVSYIKNQDLCFSNNLNDNTGKGHTDGRLKFNWSTRKFNAGKLIFYHALSKLTFRFKKGDGFSDSEFQFNSGTNVKLSNFYSQGTFMLAEGEFEQSTLKKANGLSGQNQPIDKIWQRTDAELTQAEKDEYKYILDALVIPGTDMTTDENAVTFYINSNEYKLTMAQLYAAFSDAQKTTYFESDKLKAGVHYVFTFTVGKSKIEKITAQLVPWEEVEADNIDPKNTRISLQLEERGETQTSDVAFYKAEDNKTTDGIVDNYTTYNWKTGYTNMSATWDGTHSHWTTNLFWHSNKDFYHFRALMPAATGVTTDGSGDGDYATLTSAASYTDVRWGAPMKDDGENETEGTFTWTYDPITYGFDNAGHTQIYKAIGATDDPVKLILFHTMSDLTFNIKTSNDAAKVELCHDNGNSTYTRTRLDLVGFYNGGMVLLGTGLVKTTGSASTTASPINVPFNSATDNTQYVQQVYKFGAVPQDLTAVKLYITTPDGNQYIVDLKDVKATAVNTNNIANPYQLADSKYVINRWYPGFKYTYSFTLKKTGITNLQATIVEWETVEADDEEVTIK